MGEMTTEVLGDWWEGTTLACILIYKISFLIVLTSWVYGEGQIFVSPNCLVCLPH